MKQSAAGGSRNAFLFSAHMLLLAGLSQQAGAAPFGVGYREAVELSVPEAATSNLTDRLLVSEGTLNKTGAGTLAVAVSNLTVQTGGAIAVRSGALRVEHDTNSIAAPAPCPLDVLAQAAFWVDATTNVVTVSSNGNTYADTWLDAREPDPEAPYVYTRAVASLSKTNIVPEVQMNAGPDSHQPSVWFGRFGSLRWMSWTTPGGAQADIANICHAFVVHGVFLSYGFVLGTQSNPPDFHTSDFSNGGISAPIWSATEWQTTAVRQGRTYQDGERIDGSLVQPKPGWQLLEVALGSRTAHASNFFNDRNIDFSGKRLGGDNLCEVVIFTNRLSETDRLRVQSYLLQKWLTPKPITALSAAASASGTVIADVSSAAKMTARLTGDGALSKQGNGSLILDDVPEVMSVFRSAALLAGVLDARVPVPLTLSAGDRVTASNTVITVAANAGDGQIVKEGSGTVTLTSLPSDLASLTVSAGVLVLTPPSASTSVVTQTGGSVSNANFELVPNTANRQVIPNGTTYCGWTALSPSVTGGPDNAVFIFNKTAGTAELWPCSYDAPEGLQVLALKRDSSASTTLTLPTAGIYELSFYTSGRSGYGYHEFDLCLVHGTETNRVATVQTTPAPYVRQSFRLPWLEAGDHTLLLNRNGQGVDSLGTVDDLKVQLVSAVPEENLRIFNGDFELTGYPRNPTSFTTSNLVPGWAFTASTTNMTTSGITMPGSSAYFYTPSTAYGSVMLGLVSNGIASTALTLPAGTYRLQGGVCNWPCSVNGKNLSGTQQVKATVTRSDSASVVLGTVTTNAGILSTTVWPTAFTVTNNEVVTLSLAGQTASAGGLVDNLLLVPQTNAIVLNGNFEGSANWTFVFNQAVQPKDNATYNSLSASNDYGLAFYDGTRRLLLVQTGIAYQDIQIPAPGLYRLVFHAAQRCPLTYGNAYGHNPVRAWLAQGGATNVIGWTRVDDTPLVRREFLFQVAAAGTYRFGLQGMTDNSPAFPGTDQNALIDGVSIEPATNVGDAGFALPRELQLTVASGARLQLSYVGTQTVDSVSYAGRFVTGLMTQESCPAFISGPGALFAFPKGSAIFIR